MSNPSERDPVKGRLSSFDAARLSGEVGDLAAAGRPLSTGLRATAMEMPRGRLRSALVAVAEEIERGSTVDEALASRGAALPAYIRALIAVGSRTGTASQILGRLNTFDGVGAELRRRLMISLAYPFISLAIALGIFTFICSSLVPSFENIFKDFGVSLPWITLVVIEVSHVFALSWQWGGQIFFGLLVVWVLVYFVLGAAGRRAFLGYLPVIGGVWRSTSLAEFCHLLALLLESEIPLPAAIRLTGDGVRDTSIDRACGVMARDVEGGMTLSEALSRRHVFPSGLARVLRWAEGHRSLLDALHMAGEMFEAGARGQGGVAGTVIAVLVVLWIIAVVVMIVLGLFLPLITLISKLSG